MNIGRTILGKAPKIAVSVSDREDDRLIKLPGIDLLEIRADRLRSAEPVYVKKVINRRRKNRIPLILTVRSVGEGGEKNVPDSLKLDIFRDNAPLVDAVDIELRSPILSEVRKIAKKNRKKVIISWHDLNGTPSDKKLLGILKKAKDSGADIVKIAARANDMKDLNRLIRFTVKNRSKNIITISLGSLGSVSRVIFPKLGSLITYSYVSRPSGSGQIPLKELRKYLRMSHPSKNVKPLH